MLFYLSISHCGALPVTEMFLPVGVFQIIVHLIALIGNNSATVRDSLDTLSCYQRVKEIKTKVIIKMTTKVIMEDSIESNELE